MVTPKLSTITVVMKTVATDELIFVLTVLFSRGFRDHSHRYLVFKLPVDSINCLCQKYFKRTRLVTHPTATLPFSLTRVSIIFVGLLRILLPF